MNEERDEIGNEDTWKKLKNVILALEERGGWIEDDDDLDENVTGGERDAEDGKERMVDDVLRGGERDAEYELGKERVMDDVLRAGDDREKTGMTEDDMDDMAKADDNAELGMREGMTEMMGAGDNGDEKDEHVGCGEMKKDDEMGKECKDERDGEGG